MQYDKAREDVVETARQMYHQGLVVGTWGNVSVRPPGSQVVIITPSGMEYDRLVPEDMVVVDMEGKVLQAKWKPSVELPLHLFIYRARPDAGAVVHVHSVAASAFAVAGRSIPAVLEETAQIIGGPVGVTGYQPCGTRRLAAEAVQVLGQNNAILLANHGLVGVGSTARDALRACLVAEKTAQVVIYAHLLGNVNYLSEQEISSLREGFKSYGQKKPDSIKV